MSIPYGTLRDIANELKNIREILEKQSANKVEEGEWVNKEGIPIPDQHAVYCSLCRTWSEYRDNFCGHCGAKMKR